jgi:hypothetical protein
MRPAFDVRCFLRHFAPKLEKFVREAIGEGTEPLDVERLYTSIGPTV